MVPSFKGISRGGVKKKAVGAVLDPPPIIMESKVSISMTTMQQSPRIALVKCTYSPTLAMEARQVWSA